VQSSKAAARGDHQHEATHAHGVVGARSGLIFAAIAHEREASDHEHDREEVGGPAEQKEQRVGKPRTNGPTRLRTTDESPVVV